MNEMNKKISFYANMTKPNADSVLERAIQIVTESGFVYKTFNKASELFSDMALKPPDCIITLGGDGTILRMLAHALNNRIDTSIPILGINLGRIGFFNEVGIDGFKNAFDAFCKGKYSIETKSTLRCRLDNGQEFVCLNDFLVFKNGFSSIAHMETYVDDAPIGMIRADGIIVSSAAGSTGYSISAGGPVVAPNLDVILVTPVCPHSLTARPIVASFDSIVKVSVRSECFLSGDGIQLVTLPCDAQVTISKAENKVHFIRIEERNVFKLIREKLA